MTYEYVAGASSLVRGVSRPPAGTWLRWTDDARRPVETRRYWQIAAAEPPASPAQAAIELHDRLQASVTARTVADAPVGAFLSGGIDSSIIVALMSAAATRPVRTFSVSFADPSYDESRWARMAAERWATVHHEEPFYTAAAPDAARLAGIFDEPFADVSAFSTLRVSEVARRDVTVALSGDGGDELFAGYEIYRADRWARRVRRLAGTTPWSLIERLVERGPPAPSKKGPANLARRFVEGLRRPEDLEHARWWVFWDLAERRALYTRDALDRLAGRDCFAHYRARLAEARVQGFSGLQRQLYADVTGYLADDILVKLDRTSMAVSLEARVPFLSHRVVEYAFAIPGAWKLHAGQSKRILRRAFRADLPAAIRRRGKQGFSVPLKTWLRGELRPLLRETLEPRRVRERGWFDANVVERLVAEHESGRANHAHRLWCLVALELSLDALHRRAQPPSRDTAS
jgi:asparagine synthase (glutamine-hydrolysing)